MKKELLVTGMDKTEDQIEEEEEEEHTEGDTRSSRQTAEGRYGKALSFCLRQIIKRA